MADDKTVKNWVDKTGAAPVRPRMVFADHMVVFATTGVRTSFPPERLYDDGFDQPNQALYIAGPQDLAPENHEKLKAALTAKIAEAKSFHFSARERESMKEAFMKTVALEALDEEPVMVIKHFARKLKAVHKAYGTQSELAEVADSKKHNMFSPYRANELIQSNMQDIAEVYKQTKALFRQHHKQEAFEKIEAEAAMEYFGRKLNNLDLSEEEKSAIIHESVKIYKTSEGKQRLTIDTKPIARLYHEYIDYHYSDLDKVIHEARDRMVNMAKNHNPDEPFATTPEEHAIAERIHNIAHKDVPAKPVVLAGYNDPNLVIMVDTHINGRYAGRSYPGQNMVELILSKKLMNDFNRTVSEELMHQGIDKIYKNFSLPYQNDNDVRKELLESAIAHDMKERQDYSMLGLSKNINYDVSDRISMQQEIPVKVMLNMDDPEMKEIWGLTQNGKQPYAAMQTFVHEVVIKDAIAYNRGQPLHTISTDYTRQPRTAETHAARQLREQQHPTL